MTLPVTIVSAGSPGDASAFLRAADVPHAPGLMVIAPGKERSSKKRGQRAWVPTTPRLARWGEGCGCCTVRADIATKLRRAVQAGDVHHAVVVVNPNEDLDPLVKTFTVLDPHNRRLSEVAHVARLVTTASSQAVAQAIQPSVDRTLIERLELSDHIILNTDAPESALSQAALAIVMALNPSATTSTAPQVALDTPQLSDRFSLPKAQRRSQTQVTQVGERPIQRTRFFQHRPMHSGRLLALLTNLPADVWRLTGAFWVASRPSDVGFIDAVSSQVSVRHVGTWLAAVPESRHPRGAKQSIKDQGMWDATYGDRSQDLIVAGTAVAVSNTTAALAACLLTDDELEATDTWSTLTQPALWALETS